jgi:hypothetical protein
MSDLYDSDVLLWCERQSGLLRRVAAGDPSNEAPDWPNIIEEIESMGRRERRELAKRLRLLLGHLLKWSFQPGGRCTSWELTIIEQRRRLGYHLADNPSLKADETIGRRARRGWTWRCFRKVVTGRTKRLPTRHSGRMRREHPDSAAYQRPGRARDRGRGHCQARARDAGGDPHPLRGRAGCGCGPRAGGWPRLFSPRAALALPSAGIGVAPRTAVA